MSPVTIDNGQSGFFHVWLDVNPIGNKENDEKKSVFIPALDDSFESFDDDPELQCEMRIRDIELEKPGILIINEGMSKLIVLKGHRYSQVKAIFIVSSMESKPDLIEYWKDFVKVILTYIYS